MAEVCTVSSAPSAAAMAEAPDRQPRLACDERSSSQEGLRAAGSLKALSRSAAAGPGKLAQPGPRIETARARRLPPRPWKGIRQICSPRRECNRCLSGHDEYRTRRLMSQSRRETTRQDPANSAVNLSTDNDEVGAEPGRLICDRCGCVVTQRPDDLEFCINPCRPQILDLGVELLAHAVFGHWSPGAAPRSPCGGSPPHEAQRPWLQALRRVRLRPEVPSPRGSSHRLPRRLS